MTNNSNGGEVVPTDGGSDASVPNWNTIRQNPTGVDFRVLCEKCPFLDSVTGDCRNNERNNTGVGYTIMDSSSPTMPMGIVGMMKSYEQAREVLKNNPSLRKDPEGKDTPVNDALFIENARDIRKKIRRLNLWRAGVVIGSINSVTMPEYSAACGTKVGIAVLSQIVRLNCARVNRARVDNDNLATQIANGEVWTIGSNGLANPDDLR